MAGSDKRKQSLYFPDEMLEEIHREAARLDRSFSWVVQKAWEIARTRVSKVPVPTTVTSSSDVQPPSATP